MGFPAHVPAFRGMGFPAHARAAAAPMPLFPLVHSPIPTPRLFSIPMPSSPPIPFSPPDSQVSAILRDLTSPSLSLAEVAAQNSTSTEALCLWMLTPAIREQLESTDSISTWRTRLIAKSQLCKAIGACTDILDEFHTDRIAAKSAIPPPASHPPSDIADPTSPDSLRASIVRVRACECARKTATFLFQLSRLTETPGPRFHREQSPLRSETTPLAPRPQLAATPQPPPAPARPISLTSPPVSTQNPAPAPAPRIPPLSRLTPISTFLSSVGSPISIPSEPKRIRPEQRVPPSEPGRSRPEKLFPCPSG